jgi:SAM-dependent methyltransferase
MQKTRWQYSKGFFLALGQSTRPSAEVIVPIVLALTRAKSVIDIGCGVGTWLRSFREHGVTDILGVDGPWVDTTLLQIPEDEFVIRDLRSALVVGRKFDLVVCLEVAEHLPTECADQLIDSLTSLGRVVLFSAGVPCQGGVYHVNEQWPDWWAQKFLARGYVAIDCLRKTVWHNLAIEWWYAQNTLLFVRGDVLEHDPLLRMHYEATRASCVQALIHPRLLFSDDDLARPSVRKVLAFTRRAIRAAVKSRLTRICQGVARWLAVGV